MFVHVGDMRIYQPFAKYFDELRYDGIYLASVLAFAEDERGGSIEPIGGDQVRDLRDFRLRPIGELSDDMPKVKQRFSAARWAEFKRDIAFFRAAMGPGFITSLDDHGANAPPAWVWLARLAIGHVPASETTMTIAGLMRRGVAPRDGVGDRGPSASPDAGRDDGVWRDQPLPVRDELGGRDAGHDWLVLLGFAACALRRERWVLAGALLGFGTMLRVLPVGGLLGIGAPALAWLVVEWAAAGARERGRC